MPHLNLLVTVKTYPHPSQKYWELVCTAGVDEKGNWYRLYPVDYRYQPWNKRYKKYQWIEVEVEKNKEDKRQESYKPKMETLTVKGWVDSGKDNWAARSEYVLKKVRKCPKELEKHNESLGIIKPRAVLDFKIEPVEKDWKKKWQVIFNQTNIFGKEAKELEKIPYKFSYQFLCGDETCKTKHLLMNHDWEVYENYRKMQSRYPEAKALEMVKKRFLEEVCSRKRDPYFILGTTTPYDKFIVLGVFWPKKERQARLF